MATRVVILIVCKRDMDPNNKIKEDDKPKVHRSNRKIFDMGIVLLLGIYLLTKTLQYQLSSTSAAQRWYPR